jgi:hypothetical protein
MTRFTYDAMSSYKLHAKSNLFLSLYCDEVLWFTGVFPLE